MSTPSGPRLLRRAAGAVSRRRRHRFASTLLLLAALLVTGSAYAGLAPGSGAQAASGPSLQTLNEGRVLFLKNCATCHGINLQGSTDGPSLIGVGAAAVDFQVGTGRMPARLLGAQITKKRVQFDQRQISAMAAYVASLGPGPAIPGASALDLSNANVAAGGQIYLRNCAMCHNFAGSGGALSRGKYAPSLKGTRPKYIYEAMVTGPQSMPVFPDTTLTPKDKRDLIAFLTTTRSDPSPGGARLGKLGPVTEGAVAWIVGISALIGTAVWLGAKAR